MRKFLLATLIFVVSVALAELNKAYSNANGKSIKTGAPGEGTCRDCHNSNPLNSSGGSVTISSPDLIGNQYVGGTTYQIDVTVERASINLFGFGFEALLPSGANAGTLVVTNSTQMHILTGTVSGNVRNTMTQKTNGGLGSGTKTFSFNWTAPAAGTGDVTFYATGNATNQSGNTSGDFVYSTSLALSENNPSGNMEFNAVNADMNIFPNPAVETINATLHIGQKGQYEVRLFSLSSGQQVYAETKYFHPGNNLLTIENNGWDSGIYLLQISTNEQQIQGKILLQ
jgi:hypothetical protein